jgi:hypothetical protein
MTSAPVKDLDRANSLLGASVYSSRLFAIILSAVIVVTLDVAAYVYAGAPVCFTVIVASVGAWFAWTATSSRRPACPPAAFDLYIATIVALLVMYAEQWAHDFPFWLTRVFPGDFPAGVGISNHWFVAVFPLAGSALLLLGALAYYHGTPFGRFAAWFTFAWAATTALAVYVYPLVGRASIDLLPGALTAPLPLVISLLGMHRLVRRDGSRSQSALGRTEHAPNRASSRTGDA